MNKTLLTTLFFLCTSSLCIFSFAQEPEKSCSTLFPTKSTPQEQPPAQLTPQFQEAANNYFQVITGRASKAVSTQEKMSFFSKLTQFAQEQKLSKDDFSAMVETARDKFVRKHILGIKPGIQVLELDPQKIHDLESSKALLKLSSMTEFYPPTDFIADLEKNLQDPMQSRIQSSRIRGETLASNKHQQELLESIKDLDEYAYFIKEINKPPEEYILNSTIYPNDQNPRLRQVVFFEIINYKSTITLWVLQERIENRGLQSNQEHSWKTIAHQKVDELALSIGLKLFTFYVPDINKIAIGFYRNGLRIYFDWKILDSPVPRDLIKELPHIKQSEMNSFKMKSNSYTASLLGYNFIFHDQKTNSFIFADITLPTEFGNYIRLKILHLSIKGDQDYQFTNDYIIEYDLNGNYTTHISFAKDGSFIKMIHHSLIDSSKTKLIPYSFLGNDTNYYPNQPAPAPGEDGPNRLTMYFFPIDNIQIKSSKLRLE